MYSLTALGIGFIMDLILGDPHRIPHPVILIGKLISGMENWCGAFFLKPFGEKTWREVFSGWR